MKTDVEDSEYLNSDNLFVRSYENIPKVTTEDMWDSPEVKSFIIFFYFVCFLKLFGKFVALSATVRIV